MRISEKFGVPFWGPVRCQDWLLPPIYGNYRYGLGMVGVGSIPLNPKRVGGVGSRPEDQGDRLGFRSRVGFGVWGLRVQG